MILNPEFTRYKREDLGKIDHGDHSYRHIKKGYVYMIDDGLETKIGHSSNVQHRVSVICSSQKIKFCDIYVSDLIPFCDLYEFYLHKIFADKRMFGEWFNISAEDAIKAISPGFVVYTKGKYGIRYHIQESAINDDLYNERQSMAITAKKPDIIAAAKMATSVTHEEWSEIISSNSPGMMRMLELIKIMRGVDEDMEEAVNIFNVDKSMRNHSNAEDKDGD